MGGVMLSESFIQFSVDGWGTVPSLLFDLRPNYGGGNEDNSDLLQKVAGMHCCTRCLRPCSRPLRSHTSVGDSWMLTGNSGSVSCGVTVPFFWVQVHKSWSSARYFYGWVNDELLQEGLCHRLCYQGSCTQSPWPCVRPLLIPISPTPFQGDCTPNSPFYC